MIAPTVHPVTDSIYSSLGSGIIRKDESTGWQLLLYIDAIARTMLGPIEDLVRDSDLGPGWSSLLDIDRVDSSYLGYLAQFVGASLTPGLSDLDQRARLRHAEGFSRGTPAAILEAASSLLIAGSKNPILIERDGSAYRLKVQVYRSSMPSSLSPALIEVDGFTHRLLDTNGLYGAVSATGGSKVFIDTTQAGPGGSALKIESDNGVSMVTRPLTVPTSKIVRTLRFKFESLPTYAAVLHQFPNVDPNPPNDPGSDAQLIFDHVNKKFGVSWFGSPMPATAGPQVQAGVEYILEIAADISINPRRVKGRMTCPELGITEPVNFVERQKVEPPGVFISRYIGTNHSNEKWSGWYRDLATATGTQDYIGEIEVFRLRPNADGVHNPAVPASFQDETGTLISAANPAWSKLDDLVLPTDTDNTDLIRQVAAATGDYLEIAFEDIPAGRAILAVRAVLSFSAVTALPNEGAAYVRYKDGTEVEIWGLPAARKDYSNVEINHKDVVIPPPATGWSKAEVDALRVRIGHSGDVAPNPEWPALMFEVATTKLAGSDQVEAETRKQKPGGLIMTFETLSGEQWQKVKDNYATWQDVKNAHATWNDLRNWDAP